MRATQRLHDLGQSIWVNNITRDLLTSGTLKRYIDELSVTGLTSNPTIFDHAIKNRASYDAAIREKLREVKSGERLFFELALDDITRAADLFRPIYDRTNGVDGRVSLEVSPLLSHDTASTIARLRICTPERSAQCPDQDSGHERRSPGDRRGSFLRRKVV
jgi:transaldolase